MDTQGITVRSIRVLRGPNVYAYLPVLQILLDIGSYEDRPNHSFPGFVDRLIQWLPDLQNHRCSFMRPGGFIQTPQHGTFLPHICEHVTLVLQTLMGFDVTFGRVRGTRDRGVYNVVIAYKEEEPGKAAFDTALRLTLAAMHNKPFDLPAELERLLTLADAYRLDPSTAAIIKAACARHIPILRLTPTGSLVQLGYGLYQKRICASETSHTSEIAVGICRERSLTHSMLRAVGVPVPDGCLVRSADEAWQAAQAIGLPVVLKPAVGNQGKGVSINLSSEADIRTAYAIAARYPGGALVEEYIAGRDFRLLVVNEEMIAAARRDPARIVGDGQHTVLPRENCTVFTDGTSTDVTDDVHPSNAQLARLAAQILGLDIAGVDVVCRDIQRPLREQGGAIIGVTAAPELQMHLHPTQGQSRDVRVPIVEMLYPHNSPSRIPIIAVTGTNGKTTVTRLISHMYETARWVVGMTCTDGTYIGKERIMTGDCSDSRSARAVLLHPRVEAAVLETACGGILREGLAFDGCSVGVVTNVSADHLGLDGIDTLEELAQVKRVVVEAIHRDGAAVLNAEDPLVAEMAVATGACVIYFSRSPEHHIMAAHLAEDGWGVFVEAGMIVLAQGRFRVELLEVERVPLTAGGIIRFQVLNVLAATAAAWAAGLNPAMIARALTTFKTDHRMMPGRFNVQELDGVQVILDYGRNAAALKALGEALEVLGKRRTIMAIGLPGDRRDYDLIAAIEATIPFVNEYVLYDFEGLWGRATGEIPRLLHSRLPVHAPCEYAPDRREAILRAWKRARPGDRLIIIPDNVDEAVQTLPTLTHIPSVADNASCLTPMMSGPVELRTSPTVDTSLPARQADLY
jgi:cyanophycin synthetase